MTEASQNQNLRVMVGFTSLDTF